MSYYFTIISNTDIIIETSSTTEAVYRLIHLICDDIKQHRVCGLYYTLQGMNYLYDVYDDYYFILVCSQSLDIRRGISLLKRIREDFIMRFVQEQQRFYQLRYGTWCRNEIEFYLTHADADKLRGLNVQVEEITRIICENLMKADERKFKLEQLYNHTKAREEDTNYLYSEDKKSNRQKCLSYYCFEFWF